MNLKLSVKATKLGIRVRRVTNASQGEKYGHSWLVTIPGRVTGGQRVRKQYKGSEGQKAVDFAEGKANLAKETGESGFRLTLEQQVDAERALKLLTPLGITLKEACEYAARHLRPAGGDITFADLRDRLLAEKKSKNRRPASLGSLRFYLTKIVDHFGPETLVKTATPESLSRWVINLQSSGASARHVRNYVSYAKQFFRYAHAHRFMGENPALLLEAPHVEVNPPTILTVAETRRLLQAAMTPTHSDLLPAVVLGLFCGLRSEELARLTWENVDLKRRKITISPGVGKNRRAGDWRYPIIPKAAVKFLLLHPTRSGPIAPIRFHNRVTALHADAGFLKWKETHANAKRHSFGSYASKLHNVEWVVSQMGNSIRMLVRHYQNAKVTRRQASEYFALTPEKVAGVADVIPITKTA